MAVTTEASTTDVGTEVSSTEAGTTEAGTTGKILIDSCILQSWPSIPGKVVNDNLDILFV